MKKYLFFLLLCLASFAIKAQVIHRQLAWKAPVETAISQSETVKSLCFDGASYDENRLPVFYETFDLNNASAATATIQNAVYEPLNEAEIAVQSAIKNPKTGMSSEAQVSTSIGSRDRK